MSQYSEDLKASIIARLLPPENVSVPALSEETSIPKDTLYGWRIQARNRTGGQLPPDETISSEEKIPIILETASLNELELGEYCRRKRIYPEKLRRISYVDKIETSIWSF